MVGPGVLELQPHLYQPAGSDAESLRQSPQSCLRMIGLEQAWPAHIDSTSTRAQHTAPSRWLTITGGEMKPATRACGAKETMRMHLGIRLVAAALALQMFALGAAPALSATKVSFGQVSPTATVWPGVVAAKKGFFAANGVEIDTVSI